MYLLRYKEIAAIYEMKLFAYEHPTGPVHEIEVGLGDTVLRRRPIQSGAAAAPTPGHRCGGE